MTGMAFPSVRWIYLLDHMIFRQNQKLSAREAQFIAEAFDIVFADQRRPSGDPPGRTVVDRSLTRVGEAAAELRVFHLLPETAIVQMTIVEQRLRRTHRSPGEAALLGGMVNLLGRQAGNEVRNEIVDDVR